MPPSYTVIWSGKGAMPHEEADAEYWRQRENTLLMAAPGGKGDWPSVKDTTKAVKAGSWKQQYGLKTPAPPTVRCTKARTAA